MEEPDEGGEAPCWAERVCDVCGSFLEPGRAHRCVRTAALDRWRDEPGADGVVWSLQGARQVEANLVVLGPGGMIGEHVNDVVDVLIVVVGGSATVVVNEVALPVALHDLVFVPRLAPRAIKAGPDGVRYLSTHVARPGLTVGSRSLPR